jgi:surface protein
LKPYIEGFYNEIDNMQLMEGHKDNENTVKFYEFFHTQDEFSIVMELCDYNLSQYFTIEKKSTFDCSEILELLIQLNNSFKIMVENKLVHRDLKLTNILVKITDKGKIIYKLTDYGISKQLLYLSKFTTRAGTDNYMAPEIIKDGKYNQECDLWSLGVIIHVLFFRSFPKVDGDKVTINSTGNSDLDNLLKNLLVVNPQERITWNNYFNHSFFKNNIKSDNKEGNPNQIIIKLKVTKTDINKNKDIYFLESDYYYENNSKIYFDIENEEIKSLNDGNTKIYLDEKLINFCKFFKPTKEGEYKIKIIFNNKILKDCSYLFRNCTNIKSIDLSSFDSSKVNNMYYMFGRCFNLEEINLNNFNTEKVTNMSCCFNKCKNLKKLTFPLSFNTKNAQNMEFMFHSCEKLEELTFSNNFVVDNVIEMKGMFGKCHCLEKLDLRNFNTNKVKNMCSMFDQCYNLKEILINPKTFITKNVTNMGHMFNRCNNLKNINLSHFDIQNAKFICYMFYECENLKNLNLSNFKNNDNGVDMSNMFDKCKNLKMLDISSINIVNNNKTFKMFNELTSIEKIIVNENMINKYKELFKEIKSKFSTN